MAYEVAAIIMAGQYVPTEASDRSLGGDACQLLSRAVPGNDGQVGIKGEECVARLKIRCRSSGHTPSFFRRAGIHIGNFPHPLKGGCTEWPAAGAADRPHEARMCEYQTLPDHHGARRDQFWSGAERPAR